MTLKSFLKENAKEIKKTEEFIVSDRFTDENGNPAPFTLRRLKGSEITKIQELAVEIGDNNEVKTNMDAYQGTLIVACVEEPDLLNDELLKSYDAKSPQELIDNMLTGEEYNRLLKKCQVMNGLNKNFKDIEDEAKNS